MTTWIKLVLLALSVVAGWWSLSSPDYERYLSPSAIAQWLNDANGMIVPSMVQDTY